MALLVLTGIAEAALAQLVEQLVDAVAQALLVLAQVAQLLLTLAARLALAVAPHILALLEGLVAQLLLLADHVAQFVERRHHVVVALLALRARAGHLQVLEHRLQFFQQLARGILVAGTRQVLQPVEHALEIALREHAGIAVEWTRELLRIFPHLLRQRLQVLVHRGAQLIHQLFQLFVAGAAFERLAQGVLRLAQRQFGLRNVAVLELHRHVPHARHHLAQLVVAASVGEVEIDRAQAEIDRCLGREAFRRDGERVERGEHQRLRIGIERQDAALLDQGARHRLDEDALRKLQLGRLAAALVAGLVARDQRHRNHGAGPGMGGEVARGLRRAAAGARLRQRERKFRRFEQRMHRRAGRRVVFLEREIGMRLDHAVVVVHLVVEPQRTARLPLRILDQLDRRRAVGDGSEGPRQIPAADPAQHRRAVALDQEAAFLAARRQSCVRRACARIRRRILETAPAHHVEAHIAGRADHKLAAGRYRDRRRGKPRILRGFARAQAGQHDRRAAGIDRRRDPGVDAEIGRRHHALPVESDGDALQAFAAGGEEARDRQNEHERAQRHRIAQRQPRRRPAGLELARRHERTFDMGTPERLRDRIVLVGGNLIGDRGGRPVRLAAAAVEPAQAVGDAGQPQHRQRRRRNGGDGHEQQQTDGARQRRQHKP